MEQSLTSKHLPHLIIEPSRGWRLVNVRELWHYKDLLLVLAARDVKLRYRQTALGVVWIVLGPLFTAGIFSFVFGQVAKLPGEGVPYLLFVFVGQLGWNAVSGTVARTSGSLIGNQALVSKIYFPRLLLPFSATFGVLLDFAVGVGMLVVLMAIQGVAFHVAFLLFPVFLILLLLCGLGIGLITAAVSVTYRDAGNIVGPLLSLLMYATPVLYSVGALPERLKPYLPLYYLNPFTSLIQGFRWALLGTSTPPWGYVLYAGITGTVLFVLGVFVFHRMERRFADVI